MTATRNKAADLAWVGTLTAILLAFFLLPFVVHGARFPVGPDGPVYLWWMRLAGHDGLSAVERPGVPALSLVLAGTLHLSEAAVTAALEVALGVCVGLGAWALVRSAGREDVDGPARPALGGPAPLAGLLSGLFAVHLVNGYLANLVYAVAFLGAAVALAGGRRRGVVGTSLVLAAGGLAHPQFFLVGLAVLAATAALAWRAGERSEAGRVAAAGAGGSAVLGLGLLSMLTGAELLRVDTSRDAFLRREGLGDTLRSLYRQRFLQRAPRYVHWASVPLGAYALPDLAGSLGRFLAAWAAVTVGGVVLGFTTEWLPPDRFVTFGSVLPILAALGLVKLSRRMAPRRALGALVCGGLLAAMAIGAFIPWWRAEPFITPEQADEVASIDLDGVPSGTPLVFSVGNDEPAITFWATQAANAIRAAVPADRIRDVYVSVAPGEDPGSERSQLASLYEEDIARAEQRTGRTPVEILLPSFQRDGAMEPSAILLSRNPDHLDPASGGGIAVASLALLAFLTVAGLGWAGAIARERVHALAVAPAFGMAGLILVGTALERLGLPLAGFAGPALVSALVAGGGYAFAFVLRRRAAANAPAEH